MARRRAPLAPPPYATDREILSKECEVEAFRASGPGGQHVNRTESALRVFHPPSGVVVIAQDSPSQHRNREIALDRLVEALERLNVVPKKRVPTRPTKGSKERRLESKRSRAGVKRARGRVRDEH